MANPRNWNKTNPAAASGKKNVVFQQAAAPSDPQATRDTSAYYENTLAAEDDVVISSPSDGQVITYEAASSKWKNKVPSGGGGGGSSAGYPDDPPGSPSTWDDEFNNGALDAKWSLASSDGDHGAAAYTSYDIDTTIPGHIQAHLDSGHSDNAFIIKQSTVPSSTGAFSCTLKFSITPFANFMGAYVYFLDSAESNAVRLAFEFGSNSAYLTGAVTLSHKDSGSWTFGSSVRTLNITGKMFIHLARDGSNNWRMWASLDGISWIEVTSSALSKSITLDHFTLTFALNGASADQHMACDWIRFNWLTLP